MKRVITSVNGAQRRNGGWCEVVPCPALLCSALLCLVLPCSVLLAPCHTENVHILKREKDDKHFLKRVATELCPRQQEWAGWGDWETGWLIEGGAHE